MTDQTKLRVLAIDDELTQRMLIKEYLEDAGHEVTLSEDGKRGLKVAVSTKPDIILLDFLLPLVDGNSICKSLKSNPATADIPVILVTGSRESGVIGNGLSAGADDFLTKPVDWAFLADRVANVVKRAREKRDLKNAVASLPLTSPAPDAQDFEARLAQMVDGANLRIEQAEKASRSEIKRLEDEHSKAVAQAADDARAETEQRLQRVFELRYERMSAEIEARVASSKSSFEQELSEKLAHAEQQYSRAAQETELRVQSAWAEDIAAREERHAAEMNEVRARAQREFAVERSTLQARLAAAEREFNIERQRFEAELDSASAAHEARHSAIAEAATAAQGLQAAWSLAHNVALAQSSLISALIAGLEAAASSAAQGQTAEIGRNARALRSVTTNFKLLAHAMLETTELSRQQVDVGSVIADIAHQANVIAKDRRVEVRAAQSDPSVSIECDPARLKFAVMSLVVNAIRFTPAGGYVEVGAAIRDDGCLQINVKDTGVGIAPAQLEKLRNCLRAPNTASPDSGSQLLGLGIPLVHALAGQFSGTLDLDSKLGNGTRASVIIPYHKPDRSYGRVAGAR